jgi:putative ABC transport system ATP-binding protein
VFQSFQLLPALTALENVMLPLELAGASNAAGRAREWLANVGLAARLGHYPKQLSGGEQQRVAIARAFSGEPKVLMADEPTGNLDGVTGAEVADLMFRLNRERGTTLVLVTHDTTLASRCVRRLSLAAGRLTADEAT